MINNEKTFPIAVSARHLHLSESDLQILFGSSATLTKDFDLSQPGQFAAKEKVSIEGPKGVIHNVRILGPVRQNTQVEISRTDAVKISVSPPLRQSGDIENFASVKLIFEENEVVIKNGAIIAQAHIHMTLEDANKWYVKNNEMVTVEVDSLRPITFRGVVVRVSDEYSLEMHIDTDEANTAFIDQKASGRIIKSLVKGGEVCKKV